MTNELRLMMKEVSDEMFHETISKGALQLDNNQIQTVSFVFWLCYMAEKDLNDVIKQSWESSTELSRPEFNKTEQKEFLETIPLGKDFEINNLEYFADKIKVFQAVNGSDSLTKILWKLNGIRNDISHNRIDELKYDGENLFLREVKEKILLDYFEAIAKYTGRELST